MPNKGLMDTKTQLLCYFPCLEHNCSGKCSVMDIRCLTCLECERLGNTYTALCIVCCIAITGVDAA